MAVIGYFCDRIYITHSEPYLAAVVWINNNQKINADLGSIKRISLDMGRYSIGSSGDLSQARFNVYVEGSVKAEHIAMIVRQMNKNAKWEVIEATSDGKNLK